MRENKLKENLIEYRINKKLFFEEYDPMDILLGNKKWNDLTKRISLLDQQGKEEECSDIGMYISLVTTLYSSSVKYDLYVYISPFCS